MKGHLKTIIGIVLSILLLAWALRDVSFEQVWNELRSADPLLFTYGVVINMVGFAIRAFRWGILLRPLEIPAPFGARFASICVGFAANNLLPGRVGEFARPLALSRISKVPLSSAFATLVVERILDGVALVSILFITMAQADFPSSGNIGGVDTRAAAQVIALVMLAIGIFLFVMVFVPAFFVKLAERVVSPFSERVKLPVLAGVHSFLAGLAVLRSPLLFSASAGLAFFQWWFTAWGFLVTARAFGIGEVTLNGALWLQSLIAMSVSIPSSPGAFGPFEAAARLGLALWGVPAEKSVPFGFGLHLGSLIPVTLLGVFYLTRLGLSWREVKHSEEDVEEEVEHPASTGTGS